MNRLQLIAIYLIYLIFGMIILSFIKADTFVRLFFIFALPANYFATISMNDYYLELTTFTSVIISLVLGMYIFILCILYAHIRFFFLTIHSYQSIRSFNLFQFYFYNDK